MTTTRRQMQRTCCFTSAHDFQNFSWLTMMRRRLRVSQESPESQGHHAHEHVVTRGCWSNRKVPPAIRAAVAAEPPRRRRRRRRRRRCLRCPAVEGVPPSNPARAASRARPAAAAGDFRAVSASPAAPPTTTQPLGPAWCPFPLFSHVLSPFVSRFSFLCVALCRPSKVASTAVAAAVAAVAAAGAAGMAAAARAAALAAARAPERTVAEAQARFSALFSAIRSSSLAAVDELQRRLWAWSGASGGRGGVERRPQPGSRRRLQEASQGRGGSAPGDGLVESVCIASFP